MSWSAGKIDSPHFGSVRQVSFDASGEHLLSLGEDDGAIFVWNAEDLSTSTTNDIATQSSATPVRSMLFLGDGRGFVFAGESQKIVKTDWPECTKYEDIFEASAVIHHVCENSVTKCLAAALGSQVVVFGSDMSVKSEFEVSGNVQWLGYSSSGLYLGAVDGKFLLRVWRVDGFDLVLEEQLESGCAMPAWAMASSLVIDKGADPGEFVAIDVDDGGKRVDFIIGGQRAKASALAFSVEFGCLAVCDEARCLRVVQFDSGWHRKDLFSDSFQGGVVKCVCWRGRCIAAGDEDGNIFRWSEVLSDEAPIEPALEIGKKTKTGESFLRQMTDKTMYVKPKSSVPKKAKSKAKQQTLNLEKVARPKVTKLRSNIHLTSDEDSGSEEEEDADFEQAGTENTGSLVKAGDDFLDDEEDVDIDVDALAAKQKDKVFLQSDDEDDVPTERKTIGRDFLGSEADDDDGEEQKELPKDFLGSTAEGDKAVPD